MSSSTEKVAFPKSIILDSEFLYIELVEVVYFPKFSVAVRMPYENSMILPSKKDVISELFSRKLPVRETEYFLLPLFLNIEFVETGPVVLMVTYG